MKGIRIGVLFVLITTNACSLAQILTSSVDSEELHTLINDVNQQSGIEAVHYVRGRVQKVIRSPLDMVLVGRLFEEASKYLRPVFYFHQRARLQPLSFLRIRLLAVYVGTV